MAKRRGKGEGSISKRANGTWRAYVTQSGQRIHFTGSTKTECQEWMKKTSNQIDKGMSIEGSKVTLENYLTEWLNSKESRIGEDTYRDYSRYCNQDIIPALGKFKLKDLHLELINNYYSMLIDTRGIPTINYIHRVLHCALEDATILGYLGHNPSNHAIVPKKKRLKVKQEKTLDEIALLANSPDSWYEEDFMDDEMKIWTESELSRFLITALKSPRYAIFDLEAKTGLRLSELLGLFKRDVEFKDNYALIKVRRQVKWIPKKGWVFRTPKTDAGVRTLTVGPNTARVLKEHLQSLEVLKEVHKKQWIEYGLLFPSSVGTPINMSNLRIQYNKLIVEAGIPKIRFHDMRHTVASILLTNKTPLVIVSKILGHSKPSVTLNLYCHFIPASDYEASNLLDEMTPTPLILNTMASICENSPLEIIE
jgi:integrase